MSFAFFRGEDIFPRGQLKVAPYLRNYAKPSVRREEDSTTEYHDLNTGLDGTIQGRSFGKSDNLTLVSNPDNIKPSIESGDANLRTHENLQKAVTFEKTDMTRGHLNDLRRSIQNRLTGPSFETFEPHPLAGMQCTGQRMSLAESQQNLPKRGSVSSAGDETKKAADVFKTEQLVSNGVNQITSHSVSLNKLYSSLKRMKCRRNEVGQYEDLATISMNGREFGLNKSYFKRVLASSNANTTHTRGDQEEIFLLLGGKSKPVRFENSPEGLNLLERQWRIELKSRDSIFYNSDEEGLQLLQKFRARFTTNLRTNLPERRTPMLPIPWARHVVHKGRSLSPEEKEQLKEDESGRKLSIHVYLPNAGWDEQGRNSTPTTPMSNSLPDNGSPLNLYQTKHQKNSPKKGKN
ncbi:uncharacterized protein LOC111342833 [Stylophora pistillata]|uniref:uncharacterized protein LOC111342833 n=1 Tax=Stylophora pistillata TaxID=50429 RepID=UPI000C03A116|nr:uncharacterized protein LOC111342833 [Stylophora pistillata]